VDYLPFQRCFVKKKLNEYSLSFRLLINGRHSGHDEIRQTILGFKDFNRLSLRDWETVLLKEAFFKKVVGVLYGNYNP